MRAPDAQDARGGRGARADADHRGARLALGLAALALLLPGELAAQELDVRAYTNIPVGVNLALIGYGYSSGNVLLDPTLPVEGLESDLHILLGRYSRTFGLFGAGSGLQVTVPVVFGRWQGVQTGVGERRRSTDGLGDPRLTLRVNFYGAPALHPREFRSYRQRTIVGGTLEVIAPLGQYDPTKLINLGANRWTLRSEVGVSHVMGRWVLEAAATLWLFEDNDDFFGGSTLTQDPLGALQGHVVYSFRPGLWVSFDFGFADGGTTTVDGAPLNTLQRNTRAGFTLQYPLTRTGGLRLAISNGVRTRIGADFFSLSAGYQFSWGGKTGP